MAEICPVCKDPAGPGCVSVGCPYPFDPPDVWLLKKRGLFYRPNDEGYTGIRDRAGRYTEEEARARTGNGVVMVRLEDAPEFSEMCFDDLALGHLAKQRDKAVAELHATLKAVLYHFGPEGAQKVTASALSSLTAGSGAK